MIEDQLLFGFRLNKLSLEQLVAHSARVIEGGDAQAVFACANAHSLILTEQDPEFLAALSNVEYLVADGSGVSLAGNLLGADFGPRITGYEYFYALSEELSKGVNGRKAKIFYLGSTQATLDAVSQNMSIVFPELDLCGMYSPPFGEWSTETNARILEQINAAEPDVLWVGMTAPKQEKWVHANREDLDARIIGSVGAVFDFFAGTIPRAPAWMRNIGLEWLYRFAKEPRRTWRRHVISEPAFLLKVLRQKFSPAG